MTREFKNWGEEELSDEDEEELPPPQPIYKRGKRSMATLIRLVTPVGHVEKKQPLSFGLMSKQNELEELKIQEHIMISDIESVTRCAGYAENDIKQAHAELETLKKKLAHLDETKSPSDEIKACNRAIAEKEKLITELNAKQSKRYSSIEKMKNALQKKNTEIAELSTLLTQLSKELSDELSKKKGGRRVNHRAKTRAKYRAKHRSKKSNKTRTRR